MSSRSGGVRIVPRPPGVGRRAPIRRGPPRRQAGLSVVAAAMSEDDLMRRIQRLCRDLGLLAYHTHDSRGSAPGYPDWHIVGRSRSIFRECKTETGRTTADQDEWIERLRAVGHDVGVWRPCDLFDGSIQRELVALARIPVRRSKSA